MTLQAEPLRTDRTYDLTIYFGRQTRTKCARCGRYFVASAEDHGTSGCSCGTTYMRLPTGRFTVVGQRA